MIYGFYSLKTLFKEL